MYNEELKIQESLIEVAMALTSEKNYNRLLDSIVGHAMDITKADGGTLYILEGDYLHHRIMHTISTKFSKGIDGEDIGIEPLKLGKEQISTYSAIKKETVKIDDVYDSKLFDFSGPKKFDQNTGYKTKSMLVCPLFNRNKQVVGVIQLINALNDRNEPIPFLERHISIIETFASLAGVCIENMRHIEEVRHLFESFVTVIAKTIDERTPYNKLHSENLSKRIESFGRYLDGVDKGVYKEVEFDEEAIHKLVTAAWLHDIGKIVVPLETLDKPDRLCFRYKHLMDRYELIERTLERNYYKGLLLEAHTQELQQSFEASIVKLNEFRAFVTETNHHYTFVDEERMGKINALKAYAFEGVDIPLLTDEEYEHLSIVKGTLTDGERKLVQEHMPAGERILSELKFPDYLDGIFHWIIRHHEYLDGSGYPHHCRAEDITIESRMLTMLDIFDSLVQSDRPYKKAVPKEKALNIIKEMAVEGKLDMDLVLAFEASDLWQSDL